MGIESKHSYRFGYLKSEQWSNVRLEALARESGNCQICGESSIYNDAHHMWYPENIYETRQHHLAILCRPCHDFLHTMMPECKTRDEEEGRNNWLKFSNAIIAWRRSKILFFGTADGIKFPNPVALRTRLKELENQLEASLAGKTIVQDNRANELLSKIAHMIGEFQKL